MFSIFDSKKIKTALFNGETEALYSKKLFNSIKQIDLYYIKPLYYDSKESAIDAVVKGRAYGAIIIGKNFSTALDDRILDSENADNDTISDSNLRVYIDNTNYIYAQFLVDSLTQSIWSLISDILVEDGKNRMPPPIDVVETVYAPDSRLTDFLLPGYMIAFMYLSQVTISSLLLIQERNDGLFDRAIVAGAKHQLIFMSHFITGCLMSFLNIILMFVIAFIWFKITNYGSYLLVMFLVMTQAANAITTGKDEFINLFN
jgi:huntingtin